MKGALVAISADVLGSRVAVRLHIGLVVAKHGRDGGEVGRHRHLGDEENGCGRRCSGRCRLGRVRVGREIEADSEDAGHQYRSQFFV